MKISKIRWNLVRIKLKIAFASMAEILFRPTYFFVAFGGMLVASSLVLWLPNIELVRYIMTSDIRIYDKLTFFFSVHRDVLTTFDSFAGLGIILFSVVFGINTALLVFVFRRQGFKKVPKKSGAVGLVTAVIGGGCIACGTSIITPVLLSLGVGSSVFIDRLGTSLNWIAAVLMCYSIYRLAVVSATLLKTE